MLVFLDESFREHLRTRRRFGVLSGIAIPEDVFHSFQRDFYYVRKPYHGQVLQEESEIKGKELLGKATFKCVQLKGYSYQWNLAQELLHFAEHSKLKVFGVVCYRPGLSSLVCGDERRLDATFCDLFDRINLYMRTEFPQRHAKVIFDNRDHRTNEMNARAITNFFIRSPIGVGYDGIIKVPFFAVSQGHNYGLQLADLVTTVIAMRFQGERRVDPLWRIVQRMLYVHKVGELEVSSLRVMRDHVKAQKEREPAVFPPMAEAKPPGTGSLNE